MAESATPICEHISKYYPLNIAGEPPRFWRFKKSQLPQNHLIEDVPSDTGDTCHSVVKNLTKGQRRQIVKSWKLIDIEICSNEGLRNQLLADMIV